MWLFEKINKIDKPMANLNKMRRENKLIKLETKMGNNNKHQGNPGNHQVLLGKPIFK
jgi:hypothetical protein